MPEARRCLDCGAQLGGRKTAVRCRTHANQARRGQHAQHEAARKAARAKHAADRENRRLAELARARGLGSERAGEHGAGSH